jgi:hypothetical protein
MGLDSDGAEPVPIDRILQYGNWMSGSGQEANENRRKIIVELTEDLVTSRYPMLPAMGWMDTVRNVMTDAPRYLPFLRRAAVLQEILGRSQRVGRTFWGYKMEAAASAHILSQLLGKAKQHSRCR